MGDSAAVPPAECDCCEGIVRVLGSELYDDVALLRTIFKTLQVHTQTEAAFHGVEECDCLGIPRVDPSARTIVTLCRDQGRRE